MLVTDSAFDSKGP